MASGQQGVGLPTFRTLFGVGAVGSMSDGQLLGRFVAGGDEVREAAFSALVARHGPMVLGVCRALLGDPHDADDAFQAIFLALARKARTIRDPELLGSWLYTVAQHTARKARAQRARRLDRESREEMMRETPNQGLQDGDRNGSGGLEREDAEALHEEVGRLPKTLRTPIVLCYIEGLTHEETARRLKCPVGTIRSRMARARGLLRGRLTRRGFALPALVLAAEITPRGVRAAVPASLAEQTVRAASQVVVNATVAGSASAFVSRLTEEVIATMFWNKMAMTASALVMMMLCATGVGWVLAQGGDPQTPDPGRRVASPHLTPRHEAPPAKPDVSGTLSRPPDSAFGATMTVTGRVLDPDGRPLAGAKVACYLFPLHRRRSGEDYAPRLIAPGATTDDAGRFRLSAPRTASAKYFRVCVVAGLQGFGVSWQALDPDAEHPDVDVRLRPEQLARGRLIDLQGQGAAGVNVVVTEVAESFNGDREAVVFFNLVPDFFPWPPATTTDAQGRFTLHGIGQGESVEFQVRDDRFARQDLRIKAEDASRPQGSTFVLNPSHIIEGRVTYADSGKPAAHALLVAQGGRYISGEADAEGRFRLNPFDENPERSETGEKLFTVDAHPREGELYMSLSKQFAWPGGALRQTVDFALPRGVLLRGTVKDAESGKPLEEVQVQYQPLPNVPYEPREYILTGSWTPAMTDRDGTFAMGVLPGKGHLVILGPTSEYVMMEYGSQILSRGRSGGLRQYAQAVTPIEVDRKLEPIEVAIKLKKGGTLEGRVLDPEGKPVERGALVTDFNVSDEANRWGGHRVEIRNGRFLLHGLDLSRPYHILLTDHKHRWGAAVDRSITGMGEAPLTIQLAPCGAARVRMLDASGKPLVNYKPGLQAMVIKGRYQLDYFDQNIYDDSLAAAAGSPYLDGRRNTEIPCTDAEGRVTVDGLIPGAIYRLLTTERGYLTLDSALLKDFSVASGHTTDLGDVTIKEKKAEE